MADPRTRVLRAPSALLRAEADDRRCSAVPPSATGPRQRPPSAEARTHQVKARRASGARSASAERCVDFGSRSARAVRS